MLSCPCALATLLLSISSSSSTAFPALCNLLAILSGSFPLLYLLTALLSLLPAARRDLRTSNKMSTIYDAAEADIDARHEENRFQTNTAYRDSRPTNTVTAYLEKKKAWYAFCDTTYAVLSAERRYTVTADKLHAWLRDDLISREKKRGPKKADGSRGKLGHASLYAFVAGAVDLWNEQKENGINSNPHPAPRDGHVRRLLKVRERHEAQRRREDFVDRGQGTSLEAFSSEDLLRCNLWCLQHSGANENLLRDRLALNLSVSCALRDHSIRNAELADFHHFGLPNEGPQSAYAVCMVIDIDKTIKDDKKYLMGAMRAKDVRLCTQNSLAMYFFYRWHMRSVFSCCMLRVLTQLMFFKC